MKKQNPSSLTDLADRLLCRPAFGIFFFFAVMSLVFFLSFRGIGGLLSDVLEAVLIRWGNTASLVLLRLGVSPLAVRYLTGGIYTAIASAIAFLPQTVVFFVLIRALDDCGYLSRAVFATDRFFRIFGLSGKAVIPLLLGYGCAATSVSVCDSKQGAVIRALPLVPCSARLPVILFLADTFFPTCRTPIAVLILALSFVLVFLSLLLSHGRKDESHALITELPSFRFPRRKTLAEEISEKSREYLSRAGTAVLVSCAVFTALAMLTPDLRLTENVSQSILYAIFGKISAIFRPLGFDRPEMTAALFFGFFAKENIITVLEVMTNHDLHTLLTPPAAIAFTAFSSFYAPCIFLFSSAIERSGRKSAYQLLLRSFCIAYALSLLLYTLSRILF